MFTEWMFTEKHTYDWENVDEGNSTSAKTILKLL